MRLPWSDIQSNAYGNKQGFMNFPIFEKTVDVEVAYGSGMEDSWPDTVDGFEFWAYEVVLLDCTIRPAEQSEVTFS